MSIRQLAEGKKYLVIKAFTDYDKTVHPIGESWVLEKISFVAYHDGVTFHVYEDEKQHTFRFQDLPWEQAALLNSFIEYVKEV